MLAVFICAKEAAAKRANTIQSTGSMVSLRQITKFMTSPWIPRDSSIEAILRIEESRLCRTPRANVMQATAIFMAIL
jgi:hypothetical protein